MKHKIGVRAHDFGRKSIEEMAACLREYGFMSPQLVFPKAFFEADSFDSITEDMVEHVGEVFSDFDMAVVGCYQDLSSENEEVRRLAVKRVTGMLDAAKKLGAHCVGSETSHGVFWTREEKEFHVPFMLDSIKRIVEEAVRRDVIFAVEPVNIHPLDSVEMVKRVFSEVGEDRHLRMIFDPSNLLSPEGMKDQEPLFKCWLQETGTYMDVIHLKDILWNEKGERIQVPLGKGGIDYRFLNQWLKETDRSLYLVREWLNSAYGKEDADFMKRLGTEAF